MPSHHPSALCTHQLALCDVHQCPLPIVDMQVLDGGSPLSQGKGFRSFATLNFAWGSLVKVLLAAPTDCRSVLDSSEGALIQRKFEIVSLQSSAGGLSPRSHRSTSCC